MTSPERVQIDVDGLTIAEVERVEELSGQPIDMLTDASRPKGKLLRALVFVTKTREDPSFTWEQAGDVRVDMIGSGADPTGAAD